MKVGLESELATVGFEGMIGLSVFLGGNSIPMPARGKHEVDVTLEVIVSVVAASRDERLDEHFRELEVERAFSGVKKLVVVNARFPQYRACS